MIVAVFNVAFVRRWGYVLVVKQLSHKWCLRRRKHVSPGAVKETDCNDRSDLSRTGELQNVVLTCHVKADQVQGPGSKKKHTYVWQRVSTVLPEGLHKLMRTVLLWVPCNRLQIR
jgi:hypothetical protein